MNDASLSVLIDPAIGPLCHEKEEMNDASLSVLIDPAIGPLCHLHSVFEENNMMS